MTDRSSSDPPSTEAGKTQTDKANEPRAATRPQPAATSALDGVAAGRTLAEARRVYDLATAVHERAFVGGIESSQLALKSTVILLSLLLEMEGEHPVSPCAAASRSY